MHALFQAEYELRRYTAKRLMNVAAGLMLVANWLDDESLNHLVNGLVDKIEIELKGGLS